MALYIFKPPFVNAKGRIIEEVFFDGEIPEEYAAEIKRREEAAPEPKQPKKKKEQ